MDEYYYREDDLPEKRGCRRGCIIGLLSAGFIILLAVIALMIFSVSTGISGISFTKEYNVNDKMDRIKTVIDQFYLEEVDDAQLEEGVYAGMVKGLGDPYSEYYTEQDFKDLMESSSGVYAGIGALMSQNMQTGLISITRPFEDSPAQKAGLIAGDILVAVDGNELGDQTLSEIVSQIKGEPQTEVVLTVMRGNQTLDITVVRDFVEVTTVEYKMLDENTGYIYILEFDDVTTDQFKNAVETLQSEGMEDVVIDLRDNPGGNLSTVVDIMDYILPEGMIVYTEVKYGHREEFTSDAKNVLDMPMTVLTNGYSASASEIFAGAIKDYQWGTLVGTTTYGKGIVQRVFDLGDGTAVKLTISKYYTPNGNNIHDIGIEPDVKVELPAEVYEDGVLTQEEDVQLNTALDILNGKTEEGQ